MKRNLITTIALSEEALGISRVAIRNLGMKAKEDINQETAKITTIVVSGKIGWMVRKLRRSQRSKRTMMKNRRGRKPKINLITRGASTKREKTPRDALRRSLETRNLIGKMMTVVMVQVKKKRNLKALHMKSSRNSRS